MKRDNRNRLKDNGNLLQHSREKIDPLVGIQDVCAKNKLFHTR